jgi:hypothetical protein
VAFAALTALLAACSPQTSPQPGDGNRAELAVRTLMAAEETADTTLLLDLFWPQATYDDFAEQHTYQGIQEIVGYVTSAHEWGDDVYKNPGRIHPTERGVVAEWVFSATQNRPFGNLVPRGTGREVFLTGVTIIEMEGDRIIRAADYVDTHPLLLQLGARTTFPDGAVLELSPR